MWDWLAKRSGKATIGIGALAFVGGFGISKLVGTGNLAATGIGAAAFGVTWVGLSQKVVDKIPDPYNNIFVKKAVVGATHTVLTGTIFVPITDKPTAYSREFSIPNTMLRLAGIVPEDIGKNSNEPTHIVSVMALGRYINLGTSAKNKTLIKPTAVELTHARPIDELTQAFYNGALEATGGHIHYGSVAVMGAFAHSLAPPSPL